MPSLLLAQLIALTFSLLQGILVKNDLAAVGLGVCLALLALLGAREWRSGVPSYPRKSAFTSILSGLLALAFLIPWGVKHWLLFSNPEAQLRERMDQQAEGTLKGLVASFRSYLEGRERLSSFDFERHYSVDELVVLHVGETTSAVEHMAGHSGDGQPSDLTFPVSSDAHDEPTVQMLDHHSRTPLTHKEKVRTSAPDQGFAGRFTFTVPAEFDVDKICCFKNSLDPNGDFFLRDLRGYAFPADSVTFVVGVTGSLESILAARLVRNPVPWWSFVSLRPLYHEVGTISLTEVADTERSAIIGAAPETCIGSQSSLGAGLHLYRGTLDCRSGPTVVVVRWLVAPASRGR